jgi:hypothetical protein
VTTVPPATRYYAVACDYAGGGYTLLVLRRADGHEVFGDQPLDAARWADIPALATARLARTGTYRVVGQWREVTDDPRWLGPTWQADVEVESGTLRGPRVLPARTDY